MTKATATEARHPRHGSSLDDLLKAEGVLEAFEATAIDEVKAWQIRQTKAKRRNTKTK